MSFAISRRALIGGLIGLPVSSFRSAFAAAPLSLVVHKDPACGCCEAWIAHVRKAGIAVTAIDEPNMAAVKAHLKVPDDLASCHTAEFSGYVIEGHVPARSILRLAQERPDATGLAVPGMPTGSPGMEMGPTEEVYDVVLFGAGGYRSYGRYRGATAI